MYSLSFLFKEVPFNNFNIPHCNSAACTENNSLKEIIDAFATKYWDIVTE